MLVGVLIIAIVTCGDELYVRAVGLSVSKCLALCVDAGSDSRCVLESCLIIIGSVVFLDNNQLRSNTLLMFSVNERNYYLYGPVSWLDI